VSDLGGLFGLVVAGLAILAGLGAMATYVALGTQRGRVERLEKSNGDLRNDLTDEKNRHATTRIDLQAAIDRGVRDRSVIDHLKGEVDTMTRVFEGVSGPLATMAQAMDADHKLLAGHHKEAMAGIGTLTGMAADMLQLLGDKRSRDTIARDAIDHPANTTRPSDA
jgi:hypothetical protein